MKELNQEVLINSKNWVPDMDFVWIRDIEGIKPRHKPCDMARIGWGIF